MSDPVAPTDEPTRPLVCAYCDGHGNSSAGGACGFCVEGVPLDTQADWDRTWGATFRRAKEIRRGH